MADIDKALDKDLPLEYVPCKTIKEAEQWATKNLGFKSVSFDNLAAGNFANEGLLAAKHQNLTFPDSLVVSKQRFPGGQKFGVPAKHVVWQDGKTELCINSNIYNKPEIRVLALKKEYAYKWCSTDHKYGDIYHELGHHMHFMKVGKSRYVTSCRKFPQIIKDVIKQKLSEYGADSTHELIAEVFAALETGKVVDPDILKMYNDLLNN